MVKAADKASRLRPDPAGPPDRGAGGGKLASELRRGDHLRVEVFGLDFIPLSTSRFDLIVAPSEMDAIGIRALLDELAATSTRPKPRRSPSFSPAPRLSRIRLP